MRHWRHTALLGLALAHAAATCFAQEGAGSPGESLLFAWMKDNDAAHAPFLAVIDADPESPAYGKVLTTATAGVPLEDAHHTQHALPANGQIFANAFRDGVTTVFDVSRPRMPGRVGRFERIDEYSFPHSFVTLENGNVLATFQTSGEENDQAGGLLELTATGERVRAASAAAPGETDFIRPYSLEVLPGLDRVVTTSADMWGTRATEHLQLWRLSDLALLDTIALPEGDRRNIHQIPLEVRPVGDGSSAYVVTWNCGLYHLTGIGGRALQARLIWDFSANACAIPVRMGDFWVQAVGEAWQVVVLDISDPEAPQLATVLQLPEGYQPHWIAAEPGGTRIAMTGYRKLANRIVMLNFDTGAQDLDVVNSFGTRGDGADDNGPPGVRTDRTIWPHGKSGEATPHAVVFWPASSAAQTASTP